MFEPFNNLHMSSTWKLQVLSLGSKERLNVCFCHEPQKRRSTEPWISHGLKLFAGFNSVHDAKGEKVNQSSIFINKYYLFIRLLLSVPSSAVGT